MEATLKGTLSTTIEIDDKQLRIRTEDVDITDTAPMQHESRVRSVIAFNLMLDRAEEMMADIDATYLSAGVKAAPIAAQKYSKELREYADAGAGYDDDWRRHELNEHADMHVIFEIDVFRLTLHYASEEAEEERKAERIRLRR